MKNLINVFLFMLPVCSIFAQPANHQSHQLYVGWSSKSITPDVPVALAGWSETRISTEVMDSVICTALAIETRDGNRSIETAIMVSVDLLQTGDDLVNRVRTLVKERLPNFDVNKIILNATHTHTAPAIIDGRYDVPAENMQVRDYVKFASARIADAAVEAWNSRQSAGMSWGLGQAVVGHNRRAIYSNPKSSSFAGGTAVMYGSTKEDDFLHIEGYEDHGVEMLFFWNDKKKLTGMVLNIACPSQETESMFSTISADFWHDVRVEVGKKYGKDVFILLQCAAAGDISPHIWHMSWRNKAEEEMLKRKGITRRQEIGRRIVKAIDEVYPYVQNDIKFELVFHHIYDELSIPVRRVTKAEALQAEKWLIEKPLQANWHRDVINRYKEQDNHPFQPTKVNVIRLGDVVIATNPYELYLDYGLRIKGRSNAILTFIVQLAGGNVTGGGYLTTAKAEAGGGYGAAVQVCKVGSEGGQELVEKTLEMIHKVIQ